MKVTSVQYLKPARAVDAGNLIALEIVVLAIKTRRSSAAEENEEEDVDGEQSYAGIDEESASVANNIYLQPIPVARSSDVDTAVATNEYAGMDDVEC
eukprot:gene3540-20332_t